MLLCPIFCFLFSERLNSVKLTIILFSYFDLDLVYVCDPVMGDFGPGWYVPKVGHVQISIISVNVADSDPA